MLKRGPTPREKGRLRAERRPLAHRRNCYPKTGGPLGREEAPVQIGGLGERRPLCTGKRPSRKSGGPLYRSEVTWEEGRPPVQISGPLGREEAPCTYRSEI